MPASQNKLTKFFQELKRRKVIGVIVVYATTAFILLELANILEESLNLHERFDTVITVTLIIGFPIAVVFSWIFDLSSKGITKTEPEKESPTASYKKAGEKSIVILPFENMSSDPEQEYFCDGMAEEIINALVHIGRLKVIARTSAFAFKNAHTDVREIGRKLDVQHLLEGSVRKDGNRVRITAQLIKVEDGSHLWSERFDRDFDDVFAIQDEISMAIVDTLKIKLLKTEKEAVISYKPENIEAYNLFLKSRFHFNNMSEDGLRKGEDYLEQALKIDPRYALAHAGLSICYTRYGLFGILPPKDVYQKAKIAADNALRINGALAESHTAAASVKFFFEWDWEQAEKEYKQALDISPASAMALIDYIYFLGWIGRGEEAVEFAHELVKIDPLSIMSTTNLAFTYMITLQFDQAIPLYKYVLEKDENLLIARMNLLWCYAFNEMQEEAFQEISYTEPFISGDPFFIASVGFVYAIYGEKRKALKILEDLKTSSNQKYIDPLHIAIIYAGLRNRDQVFLWLDKAFENQSVMLAGFNHNTNLWFKYVRTDKRYALLLKKLKLDKWPAKPAIIAES
ncbi:MAG: hypothetical protein ABFS12_13450 [Bacteroidota bacterium]